MSFIAQKLFAGSERTIIVKKNIIGSFVIKGLSTLTTLILVPFTINLLDQEKYGIWITIFSIVTWFNMMDIGLGNGFRNKFAEAIAQNKNDLAKKYVQTLYSSITYISGGILILYIFVSPFLNWNQILNIPKNFDENIQLIIGTVFVFFCGQLILKNISTILLSLQKTTFSNSLIFLGNILSLILIFFIDKFYKINLFSIALIFMASPIIVYSIATLIVFKNYLKEFRPTLFTFPQKKYFDELMSLGLKFFIIQITTIVMFSSSSIIITQLFGPEHVTTYSVTYQLFSGTQLIFSIILTPFWTAFTEAYTKGDLEWIKKSIKKLIIIWSVFSIGVIVLWVISPFVFKFWLGDKIVIPKQLSFQFAIFSILITWSSIFSSFLAGIGKISISLYGAIFQLIVNIPLAIILAKGLNLNLTGIILATNLNLLIPVIFLFLQTNKIINNKAYGIWNK
jgi:O-antigen/teichoic acid export membrane protein